METTVGILVFIWFTLGAMFGGTLAMYFETTSYIQSCAIKGNIELRGIKFKCEVIKENK